MPDKASRSAGRSLRASVIDGPGHDRLDPPQGRVAESDQEPVGREDLRGPRPVREGVVDRGEGRDDPVPRIVGQPGVRTLVRVLLDQEERRSSLTCTWWYRMVAPIPAAGRRMVSFSQPSRSMSRRAALRV